jgi:membrane glycosyltransferase
MQFEGAKVREQGVTFGIVVVKSHVLSSATEQATMRQLGTRVFGPIPVILMAQDSRGVPSYQGRRDIVRFLASVPMSRIPWQRYTLSAA